MIPIRIIIHDNIRYNINIEVSETIDSNTSLNIWLNTYNNVRMTLARVTWQFRNNIQLNSKLPK